MLFRFLTKQILDAARLDSAKWARGKIVIRPSYIKVASAVCSNLATAFILAAISAFALPNWVNILTGNLFLAIICIWISIKLEDLLEKI